MQFRFS